MIIELLHSYVIPTLAAWEAICMGSASLIMKALYCKLKLGPYMNLHIGEGYSLLLLFSHSAQVGVGGCSFCRLLPFRIRNLFESW